MVIIRHRIQNVQLQQRHNDWVQSAAGLMSGLIAGYANHLNQTAENEDYDGNCIDTNPFHTELQLHPLQHLCLFTLNQAEPA